VTSGVTAHRATRPDRSTAFNPLASLGLGEGEGVRDSRSFTRFPEAFGPTLVQEARRRLQEASKRIPPAVLTVSEVAVRLRVSRSTVYSLCMAGQLPHVRISNALRIASEDVEELLRRRDG
jgi:excisionase family DNA binding protein